MNYYRLWVCIIVIGIFSCQQDEGVSFDDAIDISETSIEKASFNHLDESVLKSEWWNRFPVGAQEMMAIEMKAIGKKINLEELKSRQNKANRLAESSFRDQGCHDLPGHNNIDVFLMSQQDVDEQGMLDCNFIKGNLIIYSNSENDPIVDLNPLNKLEAVGGSVYIEAHHLTNLKGLENLESIGSVGPFGYLRITGKRLQSIDNLYNLSYLYGSLRVSQTNELTAIDHAFKKLTSIPSLPLPPMQISSNSLELMENTALKSLYGFSYIAVTDEFRIEYNESLEDLDGFSRLKTIVKYLVITKNSSLNDITGLSGLEMVGNYISLHSNVNLEDCCSIFHLLCLDPQCNQPNDEIHIQIAGNGIDYEDIIQNGPCN